MDGSATCECQKFKETKLCSHIIAVAGKVGNLATILAWYNSSEFVNLTQSAARGAAKKSGKKNLETASASKGDFLNP